MESNLPDLASLLRIAPPLSSLWRHGCSSSLVSCNSIVSAWELPWRRPCHVAPKRWKVCNVFYEFECFTRSFLYVRTYSNVKFLPVQHVVMKWNSYKLTVPAQYVFWKTTSHSGSQYESCVTSLMNITSYPSIHYSEFDACCPRGF